MNPKGLMATVVCLAYLLGGVSLAGAAKGGGLEFPNTVTAADRSYLGLAKAGKFTLKDLNTPYVLLEVLNTNCPHCMAQAAALNKLFRLVQNSDLNSKVRFIGVVSNPPAAMEKWRQAYKVPFALVADPDWEIAQALKVTGTPTTLVLDKQGKVLLLHNGVFHDAQKVFNELKGRLK